MVRSTNPPPADLTAARPAQPALAWLACLWTRLEEGVAAKFHALLACRPLHAEAFRFLRTDSELVLLPVLHTAMAAVVLAAFAFSLVRRGTPAEAFFHWSTWIRAFAFVLIYDAWKAVFRAAAIAGTMQMLRGEDPTVQSCMQAVKRNVWNILGWALLNGSLGRLANLASAVSNRQSAQLEARFGTAWQSARHFALPVLALDAKPLKAAIRRAPRLHQAFAGEQRRVVLAEPVAASVIRLFGVLWGIAWLFAWSHGDWLLALLTGAATAVTCAAATALASANYAVLTTCLHGAATSLLQQQNKPPAAPQELTTQPPTAAQPETQQATQKAATQQTAAQPTTPQHSSTPHPGQTPRNSGKAPHSAERPQPRSANPQPRSAGSDRPTPPELPLDILLNTDDLRHRVTLPHNRPPSTPSPSESGPG